MNSDKDQAIDLLWQAEVLQHGTFQLKSGLKSPFYVDFRAALTQPRTLAILTSLLEETIEWEGVECLCGVPYAALPLAVVLALRRGLPFVFRRREAKQHGRSRLVEGRWRQGERCLIIEDLITTGSSILETRDALEQAGLRVVGAAALLDRQQGGVEALQGQGIHVQTVWKLKGLVAAFSGQGYVTKEQQMEIEQYVDNNRQTAQVH